MFLFVIIIVRDFLQEDMRMEDRLDLEKASTEPKIDSH